MNPVAIIKKKRDGNVLTADEINFFINNFLRGEIPEYQVSALLMSIFFRGMNAEETWSLTQSMLSSGTGRMDLSEIEGPKMAKHSTGGVGDKLTLIVVPLLASMGVTVFKMSGRGLGHTGGTLDKLESIPGLRIHLDNDQILSSLKKTGALIVAAGKDLCPADRKLYALRDVTATVDSLPLIVSSIMSKKLSEDFDGLVLDVKVGSGAFIKTMDEGEKLARALVEMGCRSGKNVTALLTDMSWPLGTCVGNALEVNECASFLKSPVFEGRLYQMVALIVAEMYTMAGKKGDAKGAIRSALESGRAWEKFLQMVSVQGGETGALEKGLPLAPVVREVTALREGYVLPMDTLQVGLLLNDLGGGRKKMEDAIDPGVGLEFCVQQGERVASGQVMARVYARREEDGACAVGTLEKLLAVGDELIEIPAVFRGRVGVSANGDNTVLTE